MFITLGEYGQRIWIGDASQSTKYVCPVCGKAIICKAGPAINPHYAHEKHGCSDSWKYDISEWRRDMLELFPEECREVVLRRGDESHKADILVDDIVIEFQQKPISPKEFEERNAFFQKEKLRVVWVFDASEAVADGTLMPGKRWQPYMMQWEDPPEVFEASMDVREKNKKFSLWLAFDNEDVDEGGTYFQRVIWFQDEELVTKNRWRFLVPPNKIEARFGISALQFFFLGEDFLRKAEAELRKKAEYNIKVSGERGHPRHQYVCPKLNTFGIPVSDEDSCANCEHCGLIATQHIGEYGCPTYVYCCYPKKIWEEKRCSPPLVDFVRR